MSVVAVVVSGGSRGNLVPSQVAIRRVVTWVGDASVEASVPIIGVVELRSPDRLIKPMPRFVSRSAYRTIRRRCVARSRAGHQDLTAQRNGLHALGVGDDRIYVDHGLTGTRIRNR
jgi:hypothetical protein